MAKFSAELVGVYALGMQEVGEGKEFISNGKYLVRIHIVLGQLVVPISIIVNSDGTIVSYSEDECL